MASNKRVWTLLKVKLWKTFESLRVSNGLSRQQLLLGLIEAYIGKAPNVAPERSKSRKKSTLLQREEVRGLVHKHITTRQLARFKHLNRLVPGCHVEDTKGKRDLYYPPSKETEVKAFLDSCPTGGRKKKLDLSDLKPCNPGEETIKDLAKPNDRSTQKQRVINQVLKFLADQSMTLDEIYDGLKLIGCMPGGAYPKGSLVNYLSKVPELVTHDKSSHTYYLTPRYQEEVEPPELEVSEPFVGALPVESEKPSLPGFFPDWAKV